MSAHTPGPWSLNKSALVKGITRVSGDYGVIAECGPVSPEHEANARLIAAAPALLKALEEITYYVSLHIGESDASAACLDNAYDAIAQARGK